MNEKPNNILPIVSIVLSVFAIAATVVAWLVSDINGKVAELRVEMNNNRAEFHHEINNDIFEVRTDMRRMRIEMREDLAAAKADFGKNEDPKAPEAQ